MHRPRRFVPIVSVASALVLGPMLAGLALAADPITIQAGDTLTSISKRHGVPIERIVRLNALPDPNRIYVGQRLRLEGDDASAPRSADPAADASTAERTHTIASGEHLTGIAKRYGTTIGAIVAANRISDPSRIFAGQRLVIPGARPASAPRPAAPAKPAPAAAPAEKRTHVVASGEHLTGIAKRYGTTIGAIVAANRISDPSRIFAGQRLVIPGAAATASTPKASTVPASMRAVMERRAEVRGLIEAEAQRHGVPAAFALAVAWQESGWRQGVVSHAGAIGVMQLLPATGDWVGEAMLGGTVNLRDARDNVRAGVRLLRHYLNRYDGNVDLVLAAYYQGQTAADRHGVYPVSRPYIASIKALTRMLGG